MSPGPLIVTFVRLVVPLFILRWPLAGSLAAAVADTFDVVLITILDMGDFTNYSRIDKALDWYYLSFMAFACRQWTPSAKRLNLSLFVWRTLGVILFEVTGFRPLLFIFPNLFEFVFFFFATRDRLFPNFKLTTARLTVALAVMLMLKLFQEYSLHVLQVQPWNWMKANFFGL